MKRTVNVIMEIKKEVRVELKFKMCCLKFRTVKFSFIGYQSRKLVELEKDNEKKHKSHVEVL